MQRIIDVYDNIGEIAEYAIFDDCAWILDDGNAKNDIRIQALEILQKFIRNIPLSLSKIIKILGFSETQTKYNKKITNILQEEIENKNSQLVTAVLRAFIQLHPSNVKNISLELKELQIFAKVLNTFPEDKDIKSVSIIVNTII